MQKVLISLKICDRYKQKSTSTLNDKSRQTFFYTKSINYWGLDQRKCKTSKPGFFIIALWSVFWFLSFERKKFLEEIEHGEAHVDIFMPGISRRIGTSWAEWGNYQNHSQLEM